MNRAKMIRELNAMLGEEPPAVGNVGSPFDTGQRDRNASMLVAIQYLERILRDQSVHVEHLEDEICRLRAELDSRPAMGVA